MTTQSNATAADNHTYINQLSNHVGAEVVLQGWLYNMRSSGKILFPQLRDGTGVVQCVVLKNAVSPELFEELKAAGQESALSIRGTVRADARAPGGYEIDVIDAKILQQVHDYPITPKEHGTEFLMDHRHLWLRSRRQHAVLKVRHTVVKAVRDFLDNDGIVDEPLRIALDLIVSGETMTLDFSRCSAACAGPLNISRVTAHRYWTYARAWLHQKMTGDAGPG